jgi:hypothetical protein
MCSPSSGSIRVRQDISGQADAKIDETRPGEGLGIDAIGIRPRGWPRGAARPAAVDEGR